MADMNIPRFWREISSRYNLVGTRCGNCTKVYFPPRIICPTCHRKSLGRMERVKLKGEGAVFSYTVVHEAPEDFEMQKPYVLAVIEMDEGPKLTAQVINCTDADLKIGTKVRSVFRKLSEEGDCGVIHYGYKFEPVR